jgi:hypothetical protein
MKIVTMQTALSQPTHWIYTNKHHEQYIYIYIQTYRNVRKLLALSQLSAFSATKSYNIKFSVFNVIF